ncbi:MAG: hypothetical protein ACRD9Q_11570 [Nitrososphaeraceae archaeon]
MSSFMIASSTERFEFSDSPELIHYKKQLDELESTSTGKIPPVPKLEFWTKTYPQ